MTGEIDRILVIRTGALGDLVFCQQSFHEIRHAHPGARIALLTGAAYAEFGRAAPWFDDVIVDPRPNWTDVRGWSRFVRELRSLAPDRVYDLQGKTRQHVLYWLVGGPSGPEWSGAAPFCAFPRPWERRHPPAPDLSFLDFLADQLRCAGVPSAPERPLGWLDAEIGRFHLPNRFMAIVPGCSPDAPHKRWPARSYAQLANRLRDRGLACVVVGAAADRGCIAEVKAAAPDIIDLGDRTSLFELAGVLRAAACVVGNDTGPVHLAAAVGAPTLALFSATSDPIWSRPPGRSVAWLKSERLEHLEVDRVAASVDEFLRRSSSTSRSLTTNEA